MRLQAVVALVVSLSLLPMGAFADDQPEQDRSKRNPRERNVMVEPATGSVDPVPDDDRVTGGNSHDGSDDQTLFRNPIDLKSWLAASSVWKSMGESQKNVAITQALQKTAFAAAFLGGTYLLLKRVPVVNRIVLAASVLSGFVGTANADETLEFQVSRAGIDRFYESYGLASRAIQMHRNQKAAMVDFHQKLYAEMVAEIANSGSAR